MARRHRRAKRVTPTRDLLWLLKGPDCWLCGKILTVDESTTDHVVPRSKGGQDTFSNCQVACAPCNSLRGNDSPTPEQWAEHYRRNGWGASMAWDTAKWDFASG